MNLIVLIVAAAAAYQLIALIAAWRQASRREHPSGFVPPVAILKPGQGRDPHFYRAIRSHAVQEYPEFEILFGAGDPEDPALD